MRNPESDTLARIDALLSEEPLPALDLCRCGGDWHGLPERYCPGASADGPPLMLTWKQHLGRLAAETPVNWLGATDPHDCPRNFMPIVAHADYDGVAVCVHAADLGMCAYTRVPEVLAAVDPSLVGLGITYAQHGLWGVDTTHSNDVWRADDLAVFGVDSMLLSVNELLARVRASDLAPEVAVEPLTLEAMLGRALALAIPVANLARYVREGGEIDGDADDEVR